MEEDLQRLKNWASHGSLRQFYTETAATTRSHGYDLAVEGDSIVFYRLRKEGGFLGLFRKTVRQPVLRIVRHDDQVDIPEESIDPEFIGVLANLLKQH